MQMKRVLCILVAFLLSVEAAFGIRFVIDREECFSHDVKYEGDTVHISFVVIKIDSSWRYSHEGVDLVVSIIYIYIYVSVCSSTYWRCWFLLFVFQP